CPSSLIEGPGNRPTEDEVDASDVYDPRIVFGDSSDLVDEDVVSLRRENEAKHVMTKTSPDLSGIASTDKSTDRTGAAERRAQRKALREARLARTRTLSESSDEVPKGILKYRTPTKRSVSECIDEMADIMHGLTLDINDSQNSVQESADDEANEADQNSDTDRPKKTVRFDDNGYQTFYIASRLYDRKHFARYHFSTRHHPQNFNNCKKKNRKKG
ncbi:hypothetical protein GZH46_00122, partial [Fragariocoptes setiger]